jgi:hypothetical protein
LFVAAFGEVSFMYGFHIVVGEKYRPPAVMNSQLGSKRFTAPDGHRALSDRQW